MTGSTIRSLLFVLTLLLTISPLYGQEPNRNIRFGLPRPAQADPRSRESYLIERPQYVLSYNNQTLIPNWVCWQLTRHDLGKAQRGPFEPDPMLPPGFTRVTTHVYDGSGFDRGHQCPAQDRSSSQADMDRTFFLTNVLPQSPSSNQKGWERLESYCRTLVREGHVLYICCGPHGIGGEGKNGHAKVIGKGRIEVTVPAKLWKVILVLPSEGAEPRRNTRAIAIIMPNDQSVGFDWTTYRVSVRDVEKLTGYTFFPTIPAEVANEIKALPVDVRVRVPVPKRTVN
jgi:endonuclease G, mitochondrial